MISSIIINTIRCQPVLWKDTVTLGTINKIPIEATPVILPKTNHLIGSFLKEIKKNLNSVKSLWSMVIALMKANANLPMALINCAVTIKAIIVIKQNNVLDSLRTDGVSTVRDVTSYILANNLSMSMKTNGKQLNRILEKCSKNPEALQDSSRNDEFNIFANIYQIIFD